MGWDIHNANYNRGRVEEPICTVTALISTGVHNSSQAIQLSTPRKTPPSSLSGIYPFGKISLFHISEVSQVSVTHTMSEQEALENNLTYYKCFCHSSKMH